MEKESRPGGIVESIEILKEHIRRESHPLKATELPSDYLRAATEYGKYYMEAFSNPQLVDFLLNRSQSGMLLEGDRLELVRSSPITVINWDSETEGIELGRKDGRPQLYFTISSTRTGYGEGQFENKIRQRYGEDENNLWTFTGFTLRSNPYFWASRDFKLEDLLNPTLLSSSLSWTPSILDIVRQNIIRQKKGAMEKKPGPVDQAKVEEGIDLFISAIKSFKNAFTFT